jgi:hypothetical protein
MQRIHLDQPERFTPQKVYQRLSVNPRGFKPNDHFLQMMGGLHPTNPIPQLFKPLCIIGNLKGVAVSPVRTSTISHEGCLTDIDSDHEGFGIDYPKFFCFNLNHGYTPFPGISPACELAESARKSIAFLFGLN